MKSFITLLFCLIALASFATIITVNPDGSAQYTDLQTAMNDADPGDTLLVNGDFNSSNTIYLEKQLHLFGSGLGNSQGYNDDFARIRYLNLRSVTAGITPSGSTISGFEFQYIYHINSNENFSDILFERNEVTVDVNIYYATSNWTMRNNVFRRDLHLHSNINVAFTNFVFENNYIEGRLVCYDRDATGMTIRNNDFVDDGQQHIFEDINGATVNNNVFWRQSPGTASADHCDGCSFNNNIVYYVNDGTHAVYLANPISGIYGTNVGANNILFQTAADLGNPIFVSYANPAGANWSPSYDYHFDPGSSAGSQGIAAGTDGTDIGVYGGAYPMPERILARIPHVTSVSSLQTSVPIGGTLQIQYSAKKAE